MGGDWAKDAIEAKESSSASVLGSKVRLTIGKDDSRFRLGHHVFRGSLHSQKDDWCDDKR